MLLLEVTAQKKTLVNTDGENIAFRGCSYFPIHSVGWETLQIFVQYEKKNQVVALLLRATLTTRMYCREKAPGCLIHHKVMFFYRVIPMLYLFDYFWHTIKNAK